MKLIHFQGDSDFSAVGFYNRLREGVFDITKLVKKLEDIEKTDGEPIKDITFKASDDGRHKDGGFITLHTFGDVDPAFIEFIRSTQDNDQTKQSDFFII